MEINRITNIQLGYLSKNNIDNNSISKKSENIEKKDILIDNRSSLKEKICKIEENINQLQKKNIEEIKDKVKNGFYISNSEVFEKSAIQILKEANIAV